MSSGRPVLTGSRRLFRATIQPRRHAINGRRFNLAIEGPPPAWTTRDKWITDRPLQACTRADIHDGPEPALQSKAGYIDARPLTPNSSKSSCSVRPDHTFGSNPDFLLGGRTSASADCKHWLREATVGQAIPFSLGVRTARQVHGEHRALARLARYCRPGRQPRRLP